MELISPQRRSELIDDTRDLLKLELRDSYLIDRDDLEAWRSGDQAKVAASYGLWRDEVASWVAAGRSMRRVRVISEPLSDYQRMSVEFSGLAVDAGEQLRWLPRRLVSAIALPGNDCFVLDGKTAMFNVLDGNADRAEIQLTTSTEVLTFCLDAFERAWALAVPHREYRPGSSRMSP
jgi:hypothetical protein